MLSKVYSASNTSLPPTVSPYVSAWTEKRVYRSNDKLPPPMPLSRVPRCTWLSNQTSDFYAAVASASGPQVAEFERSHLRMPRELLSHTFCGDNSWLLRVASLHHRKLKCHRQVATLPMRQVVSGMPCEAENTCVWCAVSGTTAEQWRVGGCDTQQRAPPSRSRGSVLPPQRLWVVVGAESSGTKLISRMVAHAANIAPYGSWDAEAAVRKDRSEVHHFSLPWGSSCQEHAKRGAASYTLPPVIQRWSPQRFETLPARFFLNVTQHMRTAATDAELAVALLVVRDRSFAELSKTSTRVFYSNDPSHRRYEDSHCSSPAAAAQENRFAYELMGDALNALPRASPSTLQHGQATQLVVSYEALMAIGVPYLQDVLHAVGLGSTWDGWVPELHNSNEQYVKQFINVSGRHGSDNCTRRKCYDGPILADPEMARTSVRFSWIKLYGERHSGTKDLKDRLVQPRLRAASSWLREGWGHAGQCNQCARANASGVPHLPAVCHKCHQTTADEFFRKTFDTNLGWKHGLPPTALQFEHLAQTGGPNCNNTLFLVTTRHPLDWVASLYNDTYIDGWVPSEQNHTLRTFVRAPAPCAARANRDGILTNCSAPWANPIRMWIEKVESYVRLAAMGCAVHVLRFVEHVTRDDTAMCALVVSSESFLGAGSGLWKDGVVRSCMRRQQLEGWNASDLVLPLVDGGVVTTGPGRARPIPPYSNVSWVDDATGAWLAAELAHMSPAAQQLTRYVIPAGWSRSTTRAGREPWKRRLALNLAARSRGADAAIRARGAGLNMTGDAQCNGAFVIQVAGFHHSGTSLMHALLLNATGQRLSMREEWVPVNETLLCRNTWAIYKRPTNDVEQVNRLMSLRKYYPQMRTVFMTRDVPSTVLSLLQRKYIDPSVANDTMLTSLARAQCSVLRTWKESTDLDFTFDLSTLTMHTAEVLQRLLPSGRMRKLEEKPRMELDGPGHEQLRHWQVHQPVYKYEPAAYAREAISPALVARLARLSCNRDR